ncbi:MAG: hypothetical protein H7X94_03820 [Vallitaleaceae bacterium]|nr:hypothetical protein [Vallitaleaceae bacterium]
MEPLFDYVKELLYKNVIIQVSMNTYQGILINVDHETVQLLSKRVEKVDNPLNINFHRCFNSSTRSYGLGAITFLPLNQIDSIIHHTY